MKCPVTCGALIRPRSIVKGADKLSYLHSRQRQAADAEFHGRVDAPARASDELHIGNSLGGASDADRAPRRRSPTSARRNSPELRSAFTSVRPLFCVSSDTASYRFGPIHLEISNRVSLPDARCGRANERYRIVGRLTPSR